MLSVFLSVPDSYSVTNLRHSISYKYTVKNIQFSEDTIYLVSGTLFILHFLLFSLNIIYHRTLSLLSFSFRPPLLLFLSLVLSSFLYIILRTNIFLHSSIRLDSCCASPWPQYNPRSVTARNDPHINTCGGEPHFGGESHVSVYSESVYLSHSDRRGQADHVVTLTLDLVTALSRYYHSRTLRCV